MEEKDKEDNIVMVRLRKVRMNRKDKNEWWKDLRKRKEKGGKGIVIIGSMKVKRIKIIDEGRNKLWMKLWIKEVEVIDLDRILRKGREVEGWKLRKIKKIIKRIIIENWNEVEGLNIILENGKILKKKRRMYSIKERIDEDEEIVIMSIEIEVEKKGEKCIWKLWIIGENGEKVKVEEKRIGGIEDGWEKMEEREENEIVEIEEDGMGRIIDDEKELEIGNGGDEIVRGGKEKKIERNDRIRIKKKLIDGGGNGRLEMIEINVVDIWIEIKE